MSESSFTCPELHTSGLAWRLLDEWYRLRQVSSLISGVIISLYLRTVQQCRLNAWACWAVAWGPMLIYVCCVRHVFNVLTLILLGTDHLTWRGGGEFEYLSFLSCIARIFFREFNIRLYDKNSESDYFFFLHQNQNIFFSNIGNQNIFLGKKHNLPLGS